MFGYTRLVACVVGYCDSLVGGVLVALVLTLTVSFLRGNEIVSRVNF